MNDSFDLEHALERMRDFVSPEIYDFCSGAGDMNSKLTAYIADDHFRSLDEPCTSSSLGVLHVAPVPDIPLLQELLKLD